MTDGIAWSRALIVGLTVGLGFAVIGTLSAVAGTLAEREWTEYFFNFLIEAALYVPIAVVTSAIAMKLRPNWGCGALGCAAVLGVFTWEE